MPAKSPRLSTQRACRTAAALLALVAVLFGFRSTLASQDSTGRMLAIGDIHGSFDGITTILRKAAVIDESHHWSGGRTVIVQTGDYTDRGPDVKKVMDLLMQLEKEAKAAGGQFLALAGNHEVMNMMGDYRDVSPEACAAFATPQSESKRNEAWQQYERLAQARAKLTTPPAAVYAQTKDAWMTAYPPGCLEYREALGPSGVYGKWLRDKDIAAVVNGSLFMHAGLNPARPAPKSTDEVNDQARAEVKRLDAFRKRLVDKRVGLSFFNLQEVLDAAVVELQIATAAMQQAKTEGKDPPALDVPFLREAQDIANEIAKWSLVDPQGPLWYRGWAQAPDDATSAPMVAFLDQMKLARIVVGHTPTNDRRIHTRFGGRAVTIDTGMLVSYFMGNPSALEIVGDRLKAIYPDSEVELK
jgi:hypothetical protein